MKREQLGTRVAALVTNTHFSHPLIPVGGYPRRVFLYEFPYILRIGYEKREGRNEAGMGHHLDFARIDVCRADDFRKTLA